MSGVLAYDDCGTGLPVVLIHGFPLSRAMWRPQVKSLTEAGYRVICPDLPGFGESPTAEGVSSMSAYADAIVALLDDLGVDQAVIGGMSMGGYILLNLAERYPERLLGMMCLVTRAAADDAAGKEKRTMLADAVKGGDRLVVPETFAQVLFAPQTAKEHPELVSEVREIMESVSVEGIVNGLLAMRDRTDYVERLPQLNLPVLVIGAEQDIAVPVEHARVLAQGVPDAQLVVIPGAGHMANLEQPEKFNQALLRFLASFT